MLPPLAYPFDAEPAAPEFVSPYLLLPCRSLTELRLELRGERYMLLLSQHEAETAGDDAAAADCLRRIAAVDARLRGIERAEHGEG